MSTKPISKEQPQTFAFTKANLDWAKKRIGRYPKGREASAVVPLLWKVQDQHDGWIPQVAIEYIADMLNMAPIRVMEVATFYSMFNLAPVGKYFVQLCGTTPCMLCGAEGIKKVCEQEIGPQRKVTSDGLFSWLEVECLGACVNAPMVQINHDFYEDLTPESFKKILDDLRAGRTVRTGTQVKRHNAAPLSGLTSLTDIEYKSKVAASPPKSTKAPAAGTLPASEGTSSNIKTVDKKKVVSKTKLQDPHLDLVDHKGEVIDKAHRPAAAAKGAKKVDNLQDIWGVGPVIESTLHELGIISFSQIASWTSDNLRWIDAYISFKGRAVRERWIEQCKLLAKGGSRNEARVIARGEK